jgi:hypothetical protein
MDSAPFIFFNIFGVILIFCALWIKNANDPRKLPFFTVIHPIKHMELNDAKIEARIIAKYVAIIGFIISFISLIFM